MNQIVEVFWRFLLLGLVSFGGPAAHIGYFQREFVEKRKWLDQQAYGQLLALSQFLPGPASSQVGFAIGLRRAGLAGAIAAFIGFTLPSFLLLFVLAVATVDSSDVSHIAGAVTGLKLLAVVVVADAVLTMAKSFCQHHLPQLIAVITCIAMLVMPSLFVQLGLLAAAALVGATLMRAPNEQVQNVQKPKVMMWPLLLFAVLFLSIPLLPILGTEAGIFADFFQAGSLVFGGGHVVLPLLQQTIGDTMSTDRFLVGYAAAQGVPGPMFSLATFLGADLLPQSPLVGALVATAAVFLPGFLLVLGLSGAWHNLANNPKVSGAAAAINASVVGLLMATLYSPVFTSAVHELWDVLLVVAGFMLLRLAKLPILYLVLGFILLGYL